MATTGDLEHMARAPHRDFEHDFKNDLRPTARGTTLAQL
jgi:hypothetical protein